VSYDLDAYRLPADLTEKALMELLETGEAEERAVPLSAEERERLVSALQAVDPSAERHDLDGETELGKDTLQLFIGEAGVTINVPYHGLDETGRSPMDLAFAYADVLTAHGLTVWDPQSESIVGGDDEGDRRAATDRFVATSGLVEQLGEGEPAPSRWKFWKR
jgi:hypothetical protein